MISVMMSILIRFPFSCKHSKQLRSFTALLLIQWLNYYYKVIERFSSLFNAPKLDKSFTSVIILDLINQNLYYKEIWSVLSSFNESKCFKEHRSTILLQLYISTWIFTWTESKEFLYLWVILSSLEHRFQLFYFD